MKSVSMLTMILTLIAFTVLFSVPVKSDRILIDLSGYDWGLFRDFEAGWIDDDIFLPPVNVDNLPVNPPACGWDFLKNRIEKTVHLPATVEEHFWGDNGNTGGVAGDFRGVSWWVTSVTLGPELAGKWVFLDFESVHLRAEVFVNRKLVGYDVIGHTPFCVDVTGALRTGENEIAVRITDPLGNFSWNDRQALKWGKHDVPACHGFGGITGRVFLRAVDPVFVENIFIKNKPAVKEIDAVITMKNLTANSVPGNITVKVYPWKKPEEVIWKKSFKRSINPSESRITVKVKARRAKVWDIEHPELYIAEVSFMSEDKKLEDTMRQRFGFRWFDTGEKNGDKRLYLNGKRIVLLGAMSWGFWPVNGVYPTREMAGRDIAAAKELGLNYMNLHRAIGQPLLMDAADEMGLLTYEEPGGYSCEGADPDATLWRDWRREKFLRMVRRDRSHPSLIIYNLQNRTPNPLTGEDLSNMRTAHEIDPTRILTFISGFWKLPPEESPEKLFFKPYDFTEYYTGWFDMHNHTSAPGYTDAFYNSPRDYLRYTGNAGEIVFWGEDGGLYSPPRLQLIKEYHERIGGSHGWLGRRFIEWFEAYDNFLDINGFREFFPDVDAFTVSAGNTTLYYHGRIIENIRAGNLDDCYTINGWAAPHLVNQSEVADLYRNPSGDPEVLARYCRPLYVAVKLRDKVLLSGSAVTADFFLINESGLRGSHNLNVILEDKNGVKYYEKNIKVKITGGEEYGRLLAERVEMKPGEAPGYYTVRAALYDSKGNLRADGSDAAFTVDISGENISRNGAVADTSGSINRFLEKTCGFTLPPFTEQMPEPEYIVVGPNTYKRSSHITSILNHVANGATAVVISGTDRFAEFLAAGNVEAVDYRGRYSIRKGNFLAGRHELLDSLPQGRAFNWEYQCLYIRPRQDIYALRLYGVKTLVAAVSDGKKEVGTALTVIPYGRGCIILSTLNILPWLNDDSPQSVVAKRLFLNFLKYAM